MPLSLDLIAATFKKKPKMPDFVPVDASQVQSETTSANQANLGQSKTLASDVNSFNQEQLLNMLRKAIPGYDNLTVKSGNIINSLLSGEIPNDVSGAISRSGAAHALGGGFAGSGMHRNLVARDLGLTSLDLTQKGLDSASRWIQTARQTAVPDVFDVTSMFLTPAQRLSFSVNERNSRFQHDWAGALNDSAYDMGNLTAAAFEKASSSIDAVVASAAGSMGGSMMGG